MASAKDILKRKYFTKKKPRTKQIAAPAPADSLR